ncbi:MAG: hypothetical protein KIT48_17230 [Pseudolabrys sp.]|nr:hypothetical protein [Pseudolabrys sp.]
MTVKSSWTKVRVDPVAFLLPVGLLVTWWAAARFGLFHNPLLPTIDDVTTATREWIFGTNQRYFFSGTW